MPNPNRSTPSGTVSSLSSNDELNSLIYGTYWNASQTANGVTSTPLTYSFLTPGKSVYASNYSGTNEYLASYALSTAQKTAVTSALGTWSAVANITFNLVTDSASNTGDLRFGGYSNMGSQTAAYAYLPGGGAVAGDVWIGKATHNANPVKGTYDFMTFVHEIGHALGLKHPFSTSSYNSTLLDAAHDNVRYSVMSYTNSYSFLPTSPMLYDIAAMQYLYGANMKWQAGNTTYSWAANKSVFETIWDGGGIDTIDASNQAAFVRIDLNEGQFSTIGKAFYDGTGSSVTLTNTGLAIAYGAKIENAIGSAYNDMLIGNALANVLDGRGGNDTMVGGLGNDTYIVSSTGDVVEETSTLASEIDSVIASVSWTLGANVENLTLTGTAALNGTGNALNNVILGNSGANVLVGGAGNDWLNGGLGADTLQGGDGNDTYVVDNLGDRVTEASDEGTDLVRSSVNFTLGDHVENGLLTGTAIYLTGNALDNILTGNASGNVLNGGAGADTLTGGLGNDTYYVDNVGDLVVESTASVREIDTVVSSISYNLGVNLENLALVGSSNIDATGNALANRLLGNAGNNVLDGGAGADTLIGGLGSDTLTGGSGADRFVFNTVGEIGKGGARDVITDFKGIEGDRIDLSAIDANQLTAANNAFVFIGTNAFSGVGQVRFVDHVLYGNVNGNLDADFEIQLLGVTTFNASHMIA